MFTWLVYKENLQGTKTLRAGFTEETDALEYASMMRDINRLAGYKDKYKVEKAKE